VKAGFARSRKAAATSCVNQQRFSRRHCRLAGYWVLLSIGNAQRLIEVHLPVDVLMQIHRPCEPRMRVCGSWMNFTRSFEPRG